MEKNEILIGREVGKGDYLIDKQYTSVGRKHARIIRKPDGIYIEDLDSANGTFVNGKSVSLKKISTSDKVTLGGVNYYTLNLENVLKLFPMSDQEFQRKFLQLRQVYEDYQKTKTKIQGESQGNMILKRSIPMALPGLLLFVLSYYFKDDKEIQRTIRMLGSLLSPLGMIIGASWASKSTAKSPERLNELREKFLIEYVCPNCGREFGERPWELIRRQGKCPACHREFHVD